LNTPPRLVVGRGGLLGAAVAARLGQPAGSTGVAWREPSRAVAELEALARSLRASASGAPWWALWCAGTGFVGADPAPLRLETDYLQAFLDAVRPSAAQGLVFLASSAGAVHAGDPHPVRESSAPIPISDYGREKLRQEGLVRAWCAATGGRAVIGRLSNLYGPGQNLEKGQGIVSHLVRASLLAQPLTIYVPLDTSRDYLYVADAARLVVATLQRAEQELAPGACAVKLLASGRLTTLASIVAELGRIRKQRPPLVFAPRPATPLQPRVLRFTSEVWPDLDAAPTTPLAEGLAAVVRDHTAALGQGQLA